MKGIQSRSGSVLTLTVLLTLLLGLLPGPGHQAMAQSRDSYTFDSNDKVLEWQNPWVNDPANNSNDQDVEFVVLNSDVAVLLVGTIPSALDIEDGRDLILDEFAKGLDDYTTIDRGAYDEFSYSLDQGTLDGAPFGIFTLFRGGEGGAPTEILIFLGLASVFADGFESAQTDISLDGDALFNGVDGEGLEAQFSDSSETAGNSDGSSSDNPETGTGGDSGSGTQPEDDGGLGAIKGDSGSSNGNDDGSSNSNDEGNEQDADDSDYLATVEDQYSAWSDDLARLLDILSNEDLGDEAIAQELSEILTEFANAPGVAAELDVPSQYSDVQGAYEDFADGLADVTATFVAFLESEQGTSAADAAARDFSEAIQNAADLGADLEAVLTDA